ncbi:MAG: LytTR family transcriptional regulator [Bacteroides sp.]|nr:LytTR family transcriptional regulator [Bacteroides sp.]MBD5362673.1 LytTR family transcriptional regulator [Bacteroides sp.]MBD5364865.1 LytTR family transcriptional regulator [Bacteroides sp.]MBD5373812.1 LytTR family transcriptional regulator [Bacteroides sp.]MDE6262545.1 LytTR family transcriptional regulator [Muribaculaceae bacterium]
MEKRLVFTSSAEIVRVPADSVVYIAAEGNYSSLRLANGDVHLLSLQLGQIERRISQMLEKDNHCFIRIGKSLIVNRNFISYIHPQRQKLLLSDCFSFCHEVTASKEALKALKDFLEKEESHEP